MERIVMKSNQVAKLLLFLLLSFLFLTPFISTSLRSSYLYFLFNLLIILLALDAGLLASISKPHDVDIKKKKPLLLSAVAYSSSTAKESLLVANGHQNSLNEDRLSTREAVTMEPLQKKQQQQLQVEVEKKKKKKMAEERVQKLKRCRSKPSIFFIGSCDINEDLGEEEEEDRRQQQVVQVEEYVGDVMSKQELFMKAEMFIGNFYKQQLKMQRQEDHSWNNIHGLYHRP